MTDIPKDAKCCDSRFAGFGFSRTICSKPAKMEHEGKFYCGIHDPVRIKDKRKAQADKWRAEADALRASRAEAEAKQAALEQDAARYRWLHEHIESDGYGYWLPYMCVGERAAAPTLDDFRATFDAAMKA